MPKVHTSWDFETELRELRAQTLAMGDHCKRIVEMAFQAFWQGKASVATEVPQIEAQIDQDEVDIHNHVLRVIALRQPVADDLRFLAAALRLTTDLERIGDEAVNISECIAEGGDGAKSLVRCELHEMDLKVQEMLDVALLAFVERDSDSAEKVLASDDATARLCARVLSKMTDHMASHADDVQPSLRIIWVAKNLERIGDHVTNMAEETIFLVRGEDVRHER